MTSGGTESIFLACLAYRNWARDENGIDVPEMVVPTSAHAAFEKSANMLGMRIRKIPCDPVSFRVDVKAMKRAINRSTCMVRTSADVVRLVTRTAHSNDCPDLRWNPLLRLEWSPLF